MQGIDDRDTGDDGYFWVATEDNCSISGATFCVAKRGNGNDTGKIGRRQPNEVKRICGTCGASYFSAEMTAEMAACDYSSDTTEDFLCEPEDRRPTYVV